VSVVYNRYTLHFTLANDSIHLHFLSSVSLGWPQAWCFLSGRFSICPSIRFLPTLRTQYFLNKWFCCTLAQVVEGARRWNNDQLLGSLGKDQSQGHTVPKVNLETRRRHHSRPLQLNRLPSSHYSWKHTPAVCSAIFLLFIGTNTKTSALIIIVMNIIKACHSTEHNCKHNCTTKTYLANKLHCCTIKLVFTSLTYGTWNLRIIVHIRPSVSRGFPSTMSCAPMFSRWTRISFRKVSDLSTFSRQWILILPLVGFGWKAHQITVFILYLTDTNQSNQSN